MDRLIVVSAASIGLILLVAFIANRLVRIRRRGVSIRMQVFIALAAVVGAFAFGLGLMVVDRIEARTVRFATLAAEEKAAVVAHLLGAEIGQYGTPLEALAARLSARAPSHLLDGVELVDPHGQVVWAPGTLHDEIPSVQATAAIEANGRVVGYVQVVKTTIAIRRLLTDFAPTVLVISLLLGATAALAALWIGRTIAGPIEELTQFASSVSAGENRSAPRLTTGREVTRLTQSIDSMRRQLQGRPFVEAFAADLSHELKNPVAAIRAAAEVLDESALEEPAEARRFVRRIREAVARIERLLGELLSLARIEARGIEGLEPINLTQIIEAACASLPKDRELRLTTESNCRVRGDHGWLTRAVSNLLENALVHSKGTVEVVLERHDTTIRFCVANSGAVDPHTKSRIFGRFVTTRADKGGTGLGLAIVRAVAEAHRGHVELQSAGPPMVRFVLTLPSA